MAYKRDRKTFEADLQKQESPYVFYGTPLPPLDEHTRDDGSYVPVWQQEVTDDRGRKRLHGAFTGGFSAGYFNTVGSKEGWTPSTFVSSRQNRRKDAKDAVEQKPEDFMDEEDLREAEESRQLSTSEGFAGFGSTEADIRRLGGLMDIFRPTGETVGVKLLKKMGWKEGQGIGPRVKRKATLDDQGTESTDTHLFAPENPSMISFLRKKDFKGVGYDGEASLEGDAEQSGRADEKDQMDEDKQLYGLSQKKPRGPRKTGFGVGVLNDTGSDDEDVYDMGPKISYNKVIGGDKKSKKKKSMSVAASNPLLKAKPVFLSKKVLAGKGLLGFRKCHDGRLPLDGFVLSAELDSFASMALDEDDFKPPELPAGWKPLSVKTNESNISNPYTSTSDAARASSHTAQSRATLLGEEQLPSKSVFDFLTPAARGRIANATGKTNLPLAGSKQGPTAFETSTDPQNKFFRDLVPELEASVAQQALGRNWLPYAEDESKRIRYRTYLELRAGVHQGRDDDLPPRASGMNTEDWVIELQEFARAAQVFKPVTGLMASRFTSSTTQGSNSGGTGADSSMTTDQLISKPATKPEDPAEVAARMGMFGPLTRSVQSWYPTRLLCKRFNVKAPDIVAFEPSDAQQSSSGSGSMFQSSSYQYNGSMDPVGRPSSTAAGPPDLKLLEAPPPTPPSLATESTVVDLERNDALEKERPGQAVFRAIFGSDDEDED